MHSQGNSQKVIYSGLQTNCILVNSADIVNSFGHSLNKFSGGGVKLTKLCRCTAQLALEYDKLDYRLEP